MRDFFRAFIAKGRAEEGRANPLFPAPKKSRVKKLMSLGMLLILLGVMSGISYRELSKPAYVISNISLTGVASLDEALVKSEIENALGRRSWIIFSQKNTFAFRPSKLEEWLTGKLPIESVSSELTGNTLKISIVEDIVMVLVHSGDAWHLIDLQGNILRELSADEVALLDAPPNPQPTETVTSLPLYKIPKVLLAEAFIPTTDSFLLPAERLTALLTLDKSLRLLGVTPQRYLLEKRKDSWLSVTLKEHAFLLKIDLDSDIEGQAKVLGALLSENQDFSSLSYIDLRFGNRVYIK